MAKNLTISYPIQNSNNGFLFGTEQVTSKAIQANLLLLLTTEVGTRWYLPDYGCDLKPLLFEPNTETINDQIKNIITASVQRYMPEISIEKAIYNVYDTEPNAKYVDIFYNYNSNTYNESSILSIRFV